MNISTAFSGGNAIFEILREDFVHIAPDLRDTNGNWFYWAFRVDHAAGKTVTFDFTPTAWVGPHGPAVSRDGLHWEWLMTSDMSRFSYTFPDDNPVYFAHDMLYQAERFDSLAEELKLPLQTLCVTAKGTPVPCFTFGQGDNHIVLTARHHCCESTGSYVLEGVLRELFPDPIPNCTFFVVPMVDYDGVKNGDQGKNRIPHDHNRDYLPEPIYPQNRAIMAYAREHHTTMLLDFHSPWHVGGANNHVFLVHNTATPEATFERFGKLLEESLRPNALRYSRKNDFPAETDWNQSSHMKGALNLFAKTLPHLNMAFSLETTYFGTAYNRVSQEKLVELGRSYADALRKYLA